MSFRVAPRAQCALVLLVLGFSVLPAGASAQDVIFVEATLSGTVRIGNESLRNVFLRADSGQLSSRGRVDAEGNSAPALSYELPVNVPAKEELRYRIQARPANLTDGTRIDFPYKYVDVAGGAGLTVDFVIDEPGFIEGQVRLSRPGGSYDPELLSSALVGFRGEGFTYMVGTNRLQEGRFRVPVQPGTVSLSPSGGSGCCYVWVKDGPKIRIAPTDAQKNLTVAAGETLELDVEIEAPATGAIAVTVAMPGPAPLHRRHGVAVVGNGINAGASANDAGEFVRGDLLPGSYGLRVHSTFGDGSDWFRHPGPSFRVAGEALEAPRVEVVAGETTSVAVSSSQAFLNGTLELSESVTNADLWRGVVEAAPAGPPGAGGLAGDTAALDGVFDLVVSPGEWQLTRYVLGIRRDDPERPINASLTVTPAAGHRPSAILSAAGDTQQLPPIELPTGTLTIRFESLDGTEFSYPWVQGHCAGESEAGERLVSAQVSARDDAVEGVTRAKVVMVGIESECRLLTAQATVDGALVTFGTLEGRFVPGVDVDVDLGAPVLTVERPEPGLQHQPRVTLSGSAKDDVVVASVTVGGVEVERVATEPGDFRKVTFEHPIDLERGPNEIVTVATDGEGKQATDTRTVIFDEGPPTVAFTPADGTVTSETDVIVEGTAGDDAGIAAVLINGEEAAFTPTGNGHGVAYSLPATLALGDNLLTVAATDVSGRTTTVTHTVTVVDNRPPTADAGADRTVEQQYPPGSNVVLDGSGSSDPDGDALSYRWTGPFSAAAGPSPEVLVHAGTHTVTLVVNDGTQDSAPDSVEITVVDTTPPVLTVSDRTVEATGPSTAVDVTGDAEAKDAVGPVTLTHDAPGAFPANATTEVTWAATDGAGNAATAVQNVTVVDTTPPALVKTQLETVLWPPNHEMVLVLTVSGVRDLVDPEPDVDIEVTSNERLDGPGDGATKADWRVTREGGTWRVWLRAERSGRGDGRVYTIEVRATDDSHNAVAESCAVTVPRDKGKRK